MATYSKIEFKKRDIRLQDIPKFYQGLVENKVSVGVHREQGSHNVDKAFWNEFGGGTFTLSTPMRKKLADGSWVRLDAGTTLRMPARPFIRLYLRPENIRLIRECYLSKINDSFQSGLKAPKTDAKEVLNEVGEGGKVAQWTNMEEWTTKLPNAPLTVAIKGFNHPLFDTGKMFNAIKYKVRKI